MAEPPGFREYVEARQAHFLRVAWLLTGDWHTAEDLLQATLLAVWPRWGRIVRTGEPDAYVRKSLVNRSLTWRRRRWHGEVPAAALPDITAVQDELGAVDLRDALARALADLGPRQRAVLVLRYYEDLSEAATAEALGCSVGTVKSQAARALASLRRLLPTEGARHER
jgi:RNA polymerase sigma-70 factor (sigma-E family)